MSAYSFVAVTPEGAQVYTFTSLGNARGASRLMGYSMEVEFIGEIHRNLNHLEMMQLYRERKFIFKKGLTNV